MQIEHFKIHLEELKRSNDLIYELGEPVPEKEIVMEEQRLNLVFFSQARSFYQHYNGLYIKSPHIEILPIQQLEFIKENLLHLSTIDYKYKICFQTSSKITLINGI